MRSVPHADRRGDVHAQQGAGRVPAGHAASTSSLAEPQAVVINSGVANAATGERGKLDALATAAEAARLLDLDAEEVLVALDRRDRRAAAAAQAAARARARGRRALRRTAAPTRPRRS